MAVDTQATNLSRITDEAHTLLDLMQGLWTEEQYLRLTDNSMQLFEFTDGSIEVLPMPTRRHQLISRFLLLALLAFIEPLGGDVLYSPLRLRLREGKFREPDLVLIRDINDPRAADAYFRGADLVVEIVSLDNPERDTVFKRAEYAEAGIPEYWIVNPQDETFTVLTLAGEVYAEHGVFRRGDSATSVLLLDFAVAVDGVFDAPQKGRIASV